MGSYFRLSAAVFFAMLAGCSQMQLGYMGVSELERAMSYYENGRLSEAREKAKSISREDPDYRAARKLIEDINSISMQLARRHMDMGEDLEKAGIYSRALFEYRESLRYNSSNILALKKVETIEEALRSGEKPAQIQKIMNGCKKHKIALKTLPSLRDVIKGQISVNQIRDISIEDLLFRDPVTINPENVRDLVCGKRVLVTGAAGSIGSELCRQILQHNPRSLILYDRNENGLYFLDHELGEKYSRDFFSVVIGDICDMNRLYMKFKKFKPEIVFHAAAYKHVPLMEDNVIEGVKNNVQGTWNVMELSDQFGVETFVQISTDKAVNPTSVMGASKRIAEMALRHMNTISRTKFIVVRFGNVLGSSGSVVPLFREQIRKGGPVTVTHPDIQRFFMTIPESVQLVLQAASMGKGGEIFVLDMGEQIKIVDLAKNMITLSGLIPEKDIKIVFSGLRPGEKLYEELFDTDEKILSTSHEKINMALSTTNGIDAEKFFDQLIGLQVLALGGDKDGVLEKMKELIPAYNQTPVDINQIISS